MANNFEKMLASSYEDFIPQFCSFTMLKINTTSSALIPGGSAGKSFPLQVELITAHIDLDQMVGPNKDCRKRSLLRVVVGGGQRAEQTSCRVCSLQFRTLLLLFLLLIVL